VSIIPGWQLNNSTERTSGAPKEKRKQDHFALYHFDLDKGPHEPTRSMFASTGGCFSRSSGSSEEVAIFQRALPVGRGLQTPSCSIGRCRRDDGEDDHLCLYSGRKCVVLLLEHLPACVMGVHDGFGWPEKVSRRNQAVQDDHLLITLTTRALDRTNCGC
jgi:hypothetical protein